MARAKLQRGYTVKEHWNQGLSGLRVLGAGDWLELGTAAQGVMIEGHGDRVVAPVCLFLMLHG